LESVTAHIDNKSNVDTVYLELAKAFDKVPHQCLLQKLKAYGIQGQVCTWIEGWLSDKTPKSMFGWFLFNMATSLERSSARVGAWTSFIFDIYQ